MSKLNKCQNCCWWDSSVLPTVRMKFIGTVNAEGGMCRFPLIEKYISRLCLCPTGIISPFVSRDFGCIHWEYFNNQEKKCSEKLCGYCKSWERKIRDGVCKLHPGFNCGIPENFGCIHFERKE